MVILLDPFQLTIFRALITSNVSCLLYLEFSNQCELSESIVDDGTFLKAFTVVLLPPDLHNV